MKSQALFFSKDKSKKLKCRLLQFLFGALRVNEQCTNLKHIKHQEFWISSHTLEIERRRFSKPPTLHL